MLATSDFITTINLLVGDSANKLKADHVPLALATALETYGTDKPLMVSKDVVGNGTSDIALSSLTSLDDRYLMDELYGLKIEYPIETSGYPVSLYRESWLFYVKPTVGKVVRLLGATPTALESVRFRYRARYVVDDDETKTTVWPADFYAVCKLAAAECCEILARAFTEVSSKAPQVDFSGLVSLGDQYTSRARTLRTQYKEHIAGPPGQPTTIQVTGQGVESVRTTDWPGDDYYA